MKVRKLAVGILATLLFGALSTSPLWAADQTMTGKVSDSMCGAKHQMAGNDASCTRTCVKGGSKYALVVGDKVYTLETADKTALDKLDEFAGASAKVTGEVKGDTITVKSVAAGS
ncbi:MAG: hypothetical protein DMG80_02010 [Acidobacteria bacterium]|nr:MAG: hypothetical protein DMG80_02010 [Acidobacteriota bacterium]